MLFEPRVGLELVQGLGTKCFREVGEDLRESLRLKPAAPVVNHPKVSMSQFYFMSQ